MIGLSMENNGLYYLEESSGQTRIENHLPFSSLSEFPASNKDKIWLHHLHLGHPPFGILKIMFPSSFEGNNIEHFHCGICGLENHKCASFSLNNEETSTPFALIHGDFLGPSTIPNVSGACFIFTY